MNTSQIHEHLIALSSEPVPDVALGWARLESALPARRQGLLSRVGSWVRRPFIISVASITLGTGAAYAAGFEPVRNGVDWAWDRVTGSADDAEDGRGSHLNDGDSEPPVTGDGEQEDRPSAVDADRDDGKLDEGSGGDGGLDRGDDDEAGDLDGGSQGGDNGGEDDDDTRSEGDGDSEDDEGPEVDEGPEDDDPESDDGLGEDDADDPSSESDDPDHPDDSGGSGEDRDLEDGREIEAPDMSEIEDGDDRSEDD